MFSFMLRCGFVRGLLQLIWVVYWNLYSENCLFIPAHTTVNALLVQWLNRYEIACEYHKSFASWNRLNCILLLSPFPPSAWSSLHWIFGIKYNVLQKIKLNPFMTFFLIESGRRCCYFLRFIKRIFFSYLFL